VRADLPICVTCGVQYSAQRQDCPICLDERQYVGWDGQRWTSLAELASAGHRGRLEEEGLGITGIGASPATAIGQRALLVRTPGGNVLWDMITYIDDTMIAAVTALGGVDSVAISHPHFYGSMIEWAHAFDAPVYIHAADRQWVARPDEAVVFWEGDTRQIGADLTLINAGVHFAGGQVLHWAGGEDGRGALFSGDIVAVVPDRRWVSFMYSYPNMVPLAAPAIRRITAALEPLSYDRLYGAFAGLVVERDAKAAVRRSAERYLRAISA